MFDKSELRLEENVFVKIRYRAFLDFGGGRISGGVVRKDACADGCNSSKLIARHLD